MQHSLRSYSTRIISLFLCVFLSFGTISCGSTTSTTTSGTTSSVGEVPADFNALAVTMNTQSSTLNQETYDFAKSFQGFFGLPSDSTAAEYKAAVDAFVADGNNFVNALDYYDQLLDSYNDHLDGTPSALMKYQSLDPLTVSDFGNVVSETQTAAQGCEAIEDVIERQECYQKLQSDKLKKVANMGVGAVLAGGAAYVAGGALAAANAPVLIVVGAGLAVGATVGAIWSWCTSSSSNLTKYVTEGDFCAFNSLEGKVITLPNGQKAVAMALPPGTGTIVVHTPDGTPITKTVTVSADGKTITVNCEGNLSTAAAVDADSCNTTTTDEDGADANATSCDQISAVLVNTSPSDPGPGVSVTVYMNVFPSIANCPISYSMSGTDGYSMAGSTTSSTSGSGYFTIPGGAEGVVDTVNVTETTNNRSKTITYTF